MSNIVLKNGRKVGDYEAPYFIAELNTSHFGDVSIARTMIERAKECGCDCVKFQSWNTESLYSNSHYRNNAIAKRIVTKFSLQESQLEELAKHCVDLQIDFSSTPYSKQEAEFLVKVCNAPFIKIASMELNNTPYLDFLGYLNVPVILSTGMGTLEEIVRAVRTLEKSGNNQIIILHCNSVYPVEPASVRLHNILGLRSEFPNYPIGYSDHSTGLAIPAAAVALGACVIEKHFTLDCSKIGMDNQMATEPEAMKEMIAACKEVQVALGGSGRILSEAEKAQIQKMRRSVIATRELKAGTIIRLEDLDAKRPGTGIEPCELHSLVGKRLKIDLNADEMIPADAVEHKV